MGLQSGRIVGAQEVCSKASSGCRVPSSGLAPGWGAWGALSAASRADAADDRVADLLDSVAGLRRGQPRFGVCARRSAGPAAFHRAGRYNAAKAIPSARILDARAPVRRWSDLPEQRAAPHLYTPGDATQSFERGVP